MTIVTLTLDPTLLYLLSIIFMKPRLYISVPVPVRIPPLPLHLVRQQVALLVTCQKFQYLLVQSPHYRHFLPYRQLLATLDHPPQFGPRIIQNLILRQYRLLRQFRHGPPTMNLLGNRPLLRLLPPLTLLRLPKPTQKIILSPVHSRSLLKDFQEGRVIH